MILESTTTKIAITGLVVPLPLRKLNRDSASGSWKTLQFHHPNFLSRLERFSGFSRGFIIF